MLDRRLADLRGVGPVRARKLAERGLFILFDVLSDLPRGYRQLPAWASGHVPEGASVSIVGRVTGARAGRLRHSPLGYAHLAIEPEEPCSLRAVRFYNQRWLVSRLPGGTRVFVAGRVQGGTPNILVGNYHQVLSESEDAETARRRLLPRYAPIKDVPRGFLDRWLAEALLALEETPDPLEGLRERWDLPSLAEAYRWVHCPRDLEQAARGEERLLFDRFCALFLPLHLREAEVEAPVIGCPPRVLDRIRRRFPFELTQGQETALAEILGDLESSKPMRRLLQGDVGSGKTAVALAAALAVVASKRQVLLMAPTEPLAWQHWEVLQRVLAGSRVRRACLSAHVTGARRRELERDLEAGSVDILVATHAVLGRRVAFHDLGLVIIDEQQRFGVRARLRAGAKGNSPHMLALSATPIPRSLCLALLGDLSHTTIAGKPPGRGPVEARVTDDGTAFGVVREAVSRGERAFLVFPSIQAEEMPAVQREGIDVVERGLLAGIPYRLLHSQLSLAEREQSLDEFRSGRVGLLLATVMVEVGIDVPEATVMVVMGAERFGLATLHQLRGRVGRGERSGLCLLVASKGASVASKARLGVLAEESDGFRIAEADLRHRGPGELLGLRQAGLAGPASLSVARDRHLFEAAREALAELVSMRRVEPEGYYWRLARSVTELKGHPWDAV